MEPGDCIIDGGAIFRMLDEEPESTESFTVCKRCIFCSAEIKRGFIVCLWLLGIILLSFAARYGASKQKFEVKKHFNRLNKPAVKSIQRSCLVESKMVLVEEKNC